MNILSDLSFVENSSRGSQAIVFVHGGGISGRMWRYAVEQLSEFHCLAPDLPGHGGSIEIRPCSLDEAVEGIANLILKEVPSQKAKIVGISVGAAVCISLANRYPENIEALFLSGPTPKFNPIATWLMNTISRPILSLLGPERRANMVAQMMDLSDKQMGEFQDDLAQITPDLVAEINELVSHQEDPITDDVPVELVMGEKELKSTKKRCLQLSRAYGNDDYAVALNLGHAWPLESPELFVNTVRAWANGGRHMEGFLSYPKCSALALEQWPDRGSDQSSKIAQKTNVWPR